MLMHILCVRDRTADIFGQPTYHTSIGMAVRSFGDTINKPDEQNVMHRHPEDFDLYDMGTFDDNTGKFDTSKPPRQIAVGKDMVRSNK